MDFVKRKAWDLNPHDPVRVARFSKPARRAVSGYLPSYRVDPLGVEPRFPACRAGVVPLDHEPLKWSVGESNPDYLGASQASSRWTNAPLFCCREVRPVIEPSPRPYQRRVRPQHLQTVVVIPDGVEPSVSWLSSRRRSRWTTGSKSD